MDAVITAARAIRAGEADLIIAGGVESMSRAPFVMPKAETAFSRNAEIYDTTIGWRFVNPLMKQQYGVDSMPETGENVAEDYKVSRAGPGCVRAALASSKAGAAQANGRLAEEIVAGRRSRSARAMPIVVDKDEHPRADTTLEMLAKLPTPFRKDGTVTAGNASGVNDGAAALIIASEAAAKKYGLEPIAPHPRRRGRRRAAAHHGHRPGAGDAEALRAARLEADRISTSIELNEAFASQGWQCCASSASPTTPPHVNPNGGAIALGHPLGMSGARIAGTAALELSSPARTAPSRPCASASGRGFPSLSRRSRLVA